MLSHLLVAAILTAGAVQEVGFGGGGRAPIVYRLDGYLDHAPEGETVYFHTIIGFGSRERSYLVTSYQRQGDGNAFDMFRNLGMFKPDFILLGPKKRLEALISATPGSRVKGTFYYRSQMHVLEIDAHSLEIHPPPS